MITTEELNPRGIILTSQEFIGNFKHLLYVMNVIRAEYGKPMLITSGVRSGKDQIRIDTAAGRTPRLGSAHIKAAACDVFAEVEGDLKKWCLSAPAFALFKSFGVCIEDFHYTPTWVHFQTIPVKSGKMFFIPY